MGALPPAPPHWLPQDDFLLKNAAEAGASLQSLAKGAVKFSRRFTVQELQDRWNTLLYDPVVSELASAEIVEFERSPALSKLNRVENDNKSVSGKRKTDSVRSCYYSMRKRICNEALPSMEMNFLTGPNLPDSTFEDPLTGFDFIDDVIPDLETGGIDATHFAVEQNDNTIDSINMPEIVSVTEFDIQILNSPVSDWEMIESTSAPSLPNVQLVKEEPETRNDFMVLVNGDANETNTHAYGIIQSEPNMEDQIACDNMGISTPDTDDLLAHIDSILNSTSEDDMFPMDNIGDEMISESYLDSYGSLLLDSPNDGQADDILPLASLSPDEHLNIAHPKEPADKSQYHYSDRDVVHVAEVQMLSSALNVNPSCPELRNGVICCTLNTEDPDIPCNDDVFLPIRMPSTSLPTSRHLKYDGTFHPPSSSFRNASSSQRNSTFLSVLKKKEHGNLEQPRMPSQKVELLQHSRTGMNRSVGECGTSYEVPNSVTGNVITRNTSSNEVPNLRNTSSNEGPKLLAASQKATTICALPVPIKGTSTKTDHTKDLNCNRNQQLQPHSSSPCLQKKTVTIKQELGSSDTPQRSEPLCAEMVSTRATILEPSAETRMLDQEDLSDDSDEEIPYFSDVEALILGMDLSPDDKDICSNKEVAQYQHLETKRTIMRLEQAADAHMQRVIATQGAFAVLYSRHSIHFIKKPEVLLGRGSADTKVDIDLSRECHGNKVSRRQAIIKINADGIFLLQNISRHLIHVNGKEIEPNNTVHLLSNSLIEVRGMTFVFEMNRSRVKQFVNEMRRGIAVF